ncbi:MAG TPA: hypothetical protein VHP63_03715 [candidate division Zixibacteria bacterium]|nr:hypothetical protein [candidate division Zixibacteria bacterium]
MNKHPVFLFFLVTLVSVVSGHSKVPDSTESNFILSVQNLLLNDQFTQADSLCESFVASHPRTEIGCLFKAGALLGQMSEKEEAVYSAELKKLVDTVIALCDEKLNHEKGADAAYTYLWRGHAHVYRSLFESHFGSFTSAIKNGFKARDDYGNGLIQDSTLYDLYFGLGNYHYWKSVKAGFLRTIGLVSNETSKGINELRLAADSGKYFRDAAKNSELWIWLEQKEYELVLVQGEKILDKFPESRNLRWPLAQAYFKSGDFKESARIYSYLRDYFDQNRGNYFNLIECDYFLHECYKKLDWKVNADEILNRVNEYRSNVPRAIQRKQLAKLNYLRRELGR